MYVCVVSYVSYLCMHVCAVKYVGYGMYVRHACYVCVLWMYVCENLCYVCVCTLCMYGVYVCMLCTDVVQVCYVCSVCNEQLSCMCEYVCFWLRIICQFKYVVYVSYVGHAFLYACYVCEYVSML